MRLTPRKEEVEAVKALLEDPDFSSADQMANAVIKQVADILRRATGWPSSTPGVTEAGG